MARDDLNKAGWQKKRRAILQRDQYTCAYCGNTEATTVDHIIPVSLGGDAHPSNLVACCIKCNSAKGGINRLKHKLPVFSKPFTPPTPLRQSLSLDPNEDDTNPFKIRP